MNNPMYEAQLNRHEEQIRDIDGRLHSYDLALKWCEGQIKRLAGDNYSPCVVCTEDKESLEEHNDNQRKEINRLLKANEALKKEIQELKTKLGVVFAEKEKVRGDYERLRQDNPFEKEYDKLKGDHNLLKEAYNKLDDRYNREKEIWSERYNELQESIDLKDRRITSLYNTIADKNKKIAALEKGTKHQSDLIDAKNSELCHLRSEICHLEPEIEKCKEACLRHQVDVNNFQGAYTEATEKVKILNENIEHLERENKHLRELYSCTVESSKKIIDNLRKGKE